MYHPCDLFVPMQLESILCGQPFFNIRQGGIGRNKEALLKNFCYGKGALGLKKHMRGRVAETISEGVCYLVMQGASAVLHGTTSVSSTLIVLIRPLM